MGLAPSTATTIPSLSSPSVASTVIEQDRNFDDLKDLFFERIYGSIKGTYRLEMTMEDIDQHMKCFDSSVSYTALDIGGGLGQVSLWLASHTTYDVRVSYYDISQEMKDHVDKKSHARITTHLGGIKESIADISSSQIICLHAVLEWLTSPIEDFKHLLGQVMPNCMLSLLYYNQQLPSQSSFASTMTTTTKKKKKKKKNRRKHPLTPFHEFDSELIESILIEFKFEIMGRTGLRVNKFQSDDTDEGIAQYLKNERDIARVEPFCRQGRYNHIVAIKRECRIV